MQSAGDLEESTTKVHTFQSFCYFGKQIITPADTQEAQDLCCITGWYLHDQVQEGVWGHFFKVRSSLLLYFLQENEWPLQSQTVKTINLFLKKMSHLSSQPKRLSLFKKPEVFNSLQEALQMNHAKGFFPRCQNCITPTNLSPLRASL